MSIMLLMWMGCAGTQEPVVAPALPTPAVAPAPLAVEQVPRLEGEADKDHIRRIVAKHKQDAEYCYVKELAKDPALAGKITVSFTITEGQVVAASMRESTLDNAQVEQCLIGAVKRLRFADDLSTQVSYPFTFQPKPKKDAGSQDAPSSEGEPL